MPSLDSIFKSRATNTHINITLPTKVHIDKVMFFTAVLYRCESWTIKKAWWWWWFSWSVVSSSSNLMECSPPGSSVNGNSYAGILEWLAISFSRESSWPRDQTLVSFIVGDLLHCRQVLYWLSYKRCPKEGLVPKTHCFQIVVLEKTLESTLDGKKVKPDTPKWNQTWIFIGRTVAEAEAPKLWPLDAKSWLIGKDLDAGKDWSQKEKGLAEEEMAR